jgi:RNA polymerase sigma-70 factor (subfamily 1)
MNSAPIELKPESYRGYLLLMAQTQLYTYSRLRHKISASDIVQETLLQAHVALPQFHGATEVEFQVWLRRILANKLTDAVRHHRALKRDAGLEKSLNQSLDDCLTGLVRLAAAQTSPSQFVLRQERGKLLADAILAGGHTLRDADRQTTLPGRDARGNARSSFECSAHSSAVYQPASAGGSGSGLHEVPGEGSKPAL